MYPEQARHLRVIKGLHGFHVYATEFWTEYLLSSVKFARGDLDNASPLLVLACKLADTLNETSNPTISEEAKSPPNGLNDRTSFLRQHPTLYKHVEAALKGRSLKRLEAELFPEAGGWSNDVHSPLHNFADTYSRSRWNMPTTEEFGSFGRDIGNAYSVSRHCQITTRPTRLSRSHRRGTGAFQESVSYLSVYLPAQVLSSSHIRF